MEPTVRGILEPNALGFKSLSFISEALVVEVFIFGGI
jgi:hypothetical protein